MPIIVAINKIDKPDAKPDRVRQDLLQHELVVEELGGDVLDVEVSAKTKTNLDKLEEAILLQAEMLDLKANPDRPGSGMVIEAKLERGRGAVATVLVQRGTHPGRRHLRRRRRLGPRARPGRRSRPAGRTRPARRRPVEVLGLQDAPLAGDDFVVVENESRAREVTEFRAAPAARPASGAAAAARWSSMFSQIAAGESQGAAGRRQVRRAGLARGDRRLAAEAARPTRSARASCMRRSAASTRAT